MVCPGRAYTSCWSIINFILSKRFTPLYAPCHLPGTVVQNSPASLMPRCFQRGTPYIRQPQKGQIILFCILNIFSSAHTGNTSGIYGKAHSISGEQEHIAVIINVAGVCSGHVNTWKLIPVFIHNFRSSLHRLMCRMHPDGSVLHKKVP